MKLFCVALSLCVFIGSGTGEEKSESRRVPCDQICESDLSDVKICGTNGLLYNSECEFDRAKCLAELSGSFLSVYSEGACVSLNSSCDIFNDFNIQCRHSDVERVCASNNVTYDSACQFMREKCIYYVNRNLSVVNTGECVYDLSSAMQIDCSQYAIDTSGLAFENGTNVRYTFECNKFQRDSICLLSGRSYTGGACHYCDTLHRQGLITPTNTLTYIQHTGKCIHSVLG